VEGGFFLDVIVTEGSAIFELFSGENKSLLVGWDTFLVLDLCLHIFDGIAWFNIESDGFTSQSFDEYLHVLNKLYFVSE